MCDQPITLNRRQLSASILALDLCGVLDNEFSQPLHHFLAELKALPAWNIILNFSGIDSVKPAGLRLMLDFCVQLKRMSRKLFCYGLAEEVMRGLKDARLDLFVHMFPSEERVLQSIAQGGVEG